MYFTKVFFFAILAFFLFEFTLGEFEECADDPNAQIGCIDRYRRTCSDYRRDDDEKSDVRTKCERGCDCKPGYIYDYNLQQCVTPEECSEFEDCADDPNAEIGCKDRYRRTCSDYRRDDDYESDVRPKCERGCDCKPGYVYDYNLQMCVTPEECTQN